MFRLRRDALCLGIIKYTFSENSCFLTSCDMVTVSQSVFSILRSMKIPSINLIERAHLFAVPVFDNCFF